MTEMTKGLCKAARVLLEWSVKDLAEVSGLSLDTLRSFESGRTRRLSRENEAQAISTFEKAGIEFIPENGGGAGVRFGRETPSGGAGGGGPDQYSGNW